MRYVESSGQGYGGGRILKSLIGIRGPPSETCGILGRLFKDRWKLAVEVSKVRLAAGASGEGIGSFSGRLSADLATHT